MIELPEAVTLAAQLHDTVTGKRVVEVIANHTPHKWAWFEGDPSTYADRLVGAVVEGAVSHGGMVEIDLGARVLVYGDGISARYHADGATLPKKHQLLIRFEDGSCLCATVRMYGGLWCWDSDSITNPYFRQAREKPSPLQELFDAAYFTGLIEAPEVRGKSAKAFLATEQRIPGLGNGVLQDILFSAGIHPRRKVGDLGATETRVLHETVGSVLTEMTARGGRDTEKDLFGRDGGYVTRLSRNTVGRPCPRCGSSIAKESYLGGTVYGPGTCQPL